MDHVAGRAGLVGVIVPLIQNGPCSAAECLSQDAPCHRGRSGIHRTHGQGMHGYHPRHIDLNPCAHQRARAVCIGGHGHTCDVGIPESVNELGARSPGRIKVSVECKVWQASVLARGCRDCVGTIAASLGRRRNCIRIIVQRHGRIRVWRRCRCRCWRTGTCWRRCHRRRTGRRTGRRSRRCSRWNTRNCGSGRAQHADVV